MDKKSNSRIYAYLAGACFAIAAIYYVIIAIRSEHTTFFQIENIVAVFLSLAAMFLQNKTALLVAFTLRTIGDLYYLISFFSVFNLLFAFADILFVVTVFFALKNKFKLCNLWFLPAALVAVCLVIELTDLYIFISTTTYHSFLKILSEWWGTFAKYLFAYGINIVAYALAGYWLYTYSPQYAPAVHNPPAKTNSANANITECLEKYKQLLDCGAITEEEFRSKKNDLLNS